MQERILIAEDEEDILKLARYNLAPEGYQVICAGTGGEGIEMTLSGLPDLVCSTCSCRVSAIWRCAED